MTNFWLTWNCFIVCVLSPHLISSPAKYFIVDRITLWYFILNKYITKHNFLSSLYVYRSICKKNINKVHFEERRKFINAWFQKCTRICNKTILGAKNVLLAYQWHERYCNLNDSFYYLFTWFIWWYDITFVSRNIGAENKHLLM